MEQNNYQSPVENTVPVAPVVVPSVDQMVAEMSNSAFNKALASAIMSNFPIASIIAIVQGNQALNQVKRIKELAEPYGIFAGGKYIAARVLALIGKFSGIAMTIFWALYLFLIIIYAAVFTSFILG